MNTRSDLSTSVVALATKFVTELLWLGSLSPARPPQFTTGVG
jgi:hypothetical protein